MASPITIVVGVARSGTTFLADLLNEEFDHGMGPESSFVPYFARRLRRYGDLTHQANLHRLIEDVCACEMLEIARKEYPEHERFDVSPEAVIARTRETTYAAVVRGVFECVADFQGKS
ncbi:MAG: sulfotransferase, partial [Pseudomonadota bacterium]